MVTSHYMSLKSPIPTILVSSGQVAFQPPNLDNLFSWTFYFSFYHFFCRSCILFLLYFVSFNPVAQGLTQAGHQIIIFLAHCLPWSLQWPFMEYSRAYFLRMNYTPLKPRQNIQNNRIPISPALCAWVTGMYCHAWHPFCILIKFVVTNT